MTKTVLTIGAVVMLWSSPATAQPIQPRAAATSAGVTIRGTGNATQVITVTAASYGTTKANVRAYSKRNGKWHLVYGPYKAWIGYNGFAPAGRC